MWAGKNRKDLIMKPNTSHVDVSSALKHQLVLLCWRVTVDYIKDVVCKVKLTHSVLEVVGVFLFVFLRAGRVGLCVGWCLLSWQTEIATPFMHAPLQYHQLDAELQSQHMHICTFSSVVPKIRTKTPNRPTPDYDSSSVFMWHPLVIRTWTHLLFIRPSDLKEVESKAKVYEPV